MSRKTFSTPLTAAAPRYDRLPAFLQGYWKVVLMNAYIQHGVRPCGEIMTGPLVVDLATLPEARERFAAGVGPGEERK